MCGSATLAIVLSTPCMIVASMIETVIAPRLATAGRAVPLIGRGGKTMVNGDDQPCSIYTLSTLRLLRRRTRSWQSQKGWLDARRPRRPQLTAGRAACAPVERA